MATPAPFVPTPESLLVEHPICVRCGECLICQDPHACPALTIERDERDD